MFRYYITPNDYLKAKERGIPENVLYARVVQHGWNIDRACLEPLQHQFKANTTNTTLNILKAHNVTLDVYRKRVLQLGWTNERALTTPILTNLESAMKGADARRKITAKQYETAELNGISKNTFAKRIFRSHWSIERATNTPVLSRHKCACLSNMVNY